jgi:uncharacterized Zn ribbon protein
MMFPDEFPLKQPHTHYFDSIDDPEARAYCEALNALFEQALNDTLYVKFVDGDRKGSIARFQVNTGYKHEPAAVRQSYARHSNNTLYEIDNGWFYGDAKWDKRRNSCQIMLPSPELVCLPNYQGPTIYQMFDRKAAKEALLEKPDQRDIDGNVLAVGDEVIYINTRYGSGTTLCHGTIKEFKVAADSKGHAFTTIVQNRDCEEVSAISYPTQMIWKK